MFVRGLRQTLSPEERKIVHAAFSALNVETDITKSGLLKFSTIDACAKKNEELSRIMDVLQKEKHNISLVKCIIQASLRTKTKKLSREAEIKKEFASDSGVVAPTTETSVVDMFFSHSSKHDKITCCGAWLCD